MKPKQAYQRGYALGNYRGLQRALFFVLGDQCRRCKTKDRRLFHVDHVFNDGANHRRQIGKEGGPAVLAAILRDIGTRRHGRRRDRYQILCANCHSLKQWRKSK